MTAMFGVIARRDFSNQEKMRYRFMMGLFGLELDKRAFERDFGVSVEKGLPLETMFMRAVGAYATDTADDDHLYPEGPLSAGCDDAGVLRRC